MFLHGIVGQMDSFTYLLGRKFLRCRPDVTLLIPKEFQPSSHLHAQHVATDIEFPLLIQQRRDVLLEQVAAILALGWVMEDSIQGLFSVSEDADTISTVCELPWL